MSSEVAQKAKATTPDEPQKKLVGGALKDAIKRQVEFYFSRGNLANDAYLVSQMNSQMFVPVEVIINFSKIKQLTDDTTLLVEAIRGSNVCVLNATEDAIKPNIKSERNTIILREIPSNTKSEEVEAIFDGCGKVESVRSDVGDTWFVTMVSEDEAVKTLLALRSKTFNNAPIKARLKSENLLKSFYPSQPAEAAPVPVPYMQGTGYYGAPVRGYYDMPAAYGVQYNIAPNTRGVNQYNNAENNRYAGRGAGNQGGRGSGGQNFRPRHNPNAPQQQQQQGQQQQASLSLREGGRNKSNSFEQRPNNGKKNKDKRGKNQNINPTPNQLKRSSSNPTERQPILNAANFPPLPSNPAEQQQLEPIVYEPIQFKYTHEDIMEIVKNMDDNDCTLPEGKMDFEAHSAALTSDAHPDLLRNQRTYSMEQAREAMRQGRPIRSDSIGSIDYESMMYGEDYTKEAREQRKQKASEAATKSPAPSTSSKKESTPSKAADKVLGYAAAVINGSPAPPPGPVVDTSAAASSTGVAGGGNASTSAATTGKKKNQKKTPKGGDKKNKKKNNAETAAPVDDLPKSGAWGGRNFLDVVKSAPTEAPASATPKTTTTPATPVAPSATKKTSLEQQPKKEKAPLSTSEQRSEN